MMNKSYYADERKYEPIDVINDWGLGFNLGNAVKYISRIGRKSSDINQSLMDIDKAMDYLQYERKMILNYQKEIIDGNK